MAMKPIDSSWSGARNSDTAMREFRQKADEAREKNGGQNIGKFLNEVTGGAAVDKNAADKAKSKNELGKDSFLKILMAQLSNQNPLDPMDSREMTAQMAQFSALEQLVNINTKMDKLGGDKTSSFLDAAQLIGMEIKANTNNIDMTEAKATEFGFTLPANADSMKITIRDPNGIVVRTLERAQTVSGPQKIKWDARDSYGAPVPPGEYSYNVEALGPKGARIPVTTEMKGVVTGIQSERGQPVLMMGNNKVRLADIRGVQVPQALTNSSAPPVEGEQQSGVSPVQAIPGVPTSGASSASPAASGSAPQSPANLSAPRTPQPQAPTSATQAQPAVTPKVSDQAEIIRGKNEPFGHSLTNASVFTFGR